MEFAFDEDHLDYQKAIAGMLGSASSVGALRAVWETGHGYAHGQWTALAESGLPGIVVPEEFEGSGGDIVDLLLPLEECGAVCLPEPFVETTLVAPMMLDRWGSEAQRQRWLPALAEGTAIFAVSEGSEASIVADGASADAVLAVIDDAVHLFARGEYEFREVESTDPARRLAVCTFAPQAETLLSDDPEAAAELLAFGAVGTAAALVGAARQMTEMTREHLLTRQQFGQVLGSFQALKHRLADVALQTEAARSLVWYAGYTLAYSPEHGIAAARLAKAAANEAGRAASFASLQLHGGIGFTWEHHLHFWLQRERSWELAFGTTEEHRMRTGASVLDGLSAA